MINFLKRKRYISVFISILLVFQIFMLSSIPGSSIRTGGINFSILYHFCAFFLLTFFLLLSFKEGKKIKLKEIVFSIIICLIFAALDEIHQLFVPLRSCSLDDLLTDSSGSLLATLMFIISKNTVEDKDKKERTKNKVKYKKDKK